MTNACENSGQSRASINLDNLVPADILPHLNTSERTYLSEVFERFDGYPELEQLWQLMDDEWHRHGCDPLDLDDRVTAFYRHPVWLLNGLFIEQDDESLAYRRGFVDWIRQQNPGRVADFGGGFGGLARLLGTGLPDADIEVVDPYPHAAARAVTATTPNVNFVDKLTGEYDMLIATDVFEHVADPIGLAAETATHLREGGQYLMANCFKPLILCHLPQLFHFDIAWDASMRAMGLIPGPTVIYGRAYHRIGELNVERARAAGERGQAIERWTRHLPFASAGIGRATVSVTCRVFPVR